ncbi:hypothetical protein B2J93_7288 [Marssonina coronariae]|uniref:Uncharacterized protein n=1 Tax=Diplocarpon coronariae TaxID=2795749 RepID=A0A218Z0S3_9HELO|nr:hypothetical protein B2J93_7288 [Marssonina coronariae]
MRCHARESRKTRKTSIGPDPGTDPCTPRLGLRAFLAHTNSHAPAGSSVQRHRVFPRPLGTPRAHGNPQAFRVLDLSRAVIFVGFGGLGVESLGEAVGANGKRSVTEHHVAMRATASELGRVERVLLRSRDRRRRKDSSGREESGELHLQEQQRLGEKKSRYKGG